MMPRPWTTCALMFALCLPAQATVPLQVPTQGVLRDNAGMPVLEGTFEMTFSLYDGADAQAPVWTETWPEVQVTGGTFRAMLGAEAALDSSVFASQGGLWLGVSVEGEPELPRRPLGSTPFARHAGAAEHLMCTGCVQAEMLSPDARATLSTEAVEAVEAAGYAKQADLVVTEDKLPADGLNEVSNGLMTNEFVHTFEASGPVDIEDDYPPGVVSQIDVGDVGTAQGLVVHVELSNSDMATVTVTLFDPTGFEHTLWSQSGPGTGLIATYPAPDAQVDGDLNTWLGQNPQGAWILKVVDDGFLNNDLDGAIDGWSIQIDTVSNKTVQIDGDLVVNGAISGPSGIVVGAGTAPCDSAHAGAIQFDPASKRLTFCTGDELLQLKACSTTCPAADEVSCGAPITNDCGGPCAGAGSSTNAVQCLANVSSTACGLAVVDACDNACGTTGTALDLDSCPSPTSVTCGEQVLDPCGNVCGEIGDQCAPNAICSEGSCLGPGESEQNPGVSCQDILDNDPSAADALYWLHLDNPGQAAVQVWCDMESDKGWALAYILCQSGQGSAQSDGLSKATPITPTTGSPVSSLGYDRVLALDPSEARFTSTHVGGTGYVLPWSNLIPSWNPAQVLLEGTMSSGNMNQCVSLGPQLAGSTGLSCSNLIIEHNNPGNESHDIPTISCGCDVWNINPQGMLWGQIDSLSSYHGASHHLGLSNWSAAPSSSDGCILMYVR